jgi:hypothetical protein
MTLPYALLDVCTTFNFILTTYQDYDYDFQHWLFFQIGARWENDWVIRAWMGNGVTTNHQNLNGCFFDIWYTL